MRSRKRLALGLVLASAAAFAVLITGHPANRSLLADLVSQDQAGYGYGYGNPYGLGPILQLSPSQAAPGDRITVTGSGFPRCTTYVTWVLSRDRPYPSGIAKGSGGSFSASITVPASEPAGTFTVDAACYSPSGRVIPLASTPLRVSRQINSSSGPSGGPPGQASGNNGALPGLGAAAGGAALAFLLLLWVRASRRRLDGRWVKKHLRAVATPLPGSAAIRHGTDARRVSLALEAHGGISGTARIEEVGQ
jgi:hypothetical protein